MKLKLTIFSLMFAFGVFNASDATAQGTTEKRGVINWKSDKNDRVPAGISDAKMDNAKKRNVNANANTSVTSKKRKYTANRKPVANQRHDASSFAKPSKWIQKRIPDKKDTDPGQNNVATDEVADQ